MADSDGIAPPLIPMIQYTAVELRRLHLHIYAPSAEKMFALLRRADPSRATASVRDILQSHARACHHYRPFSLRPFRLCSSILPDELLFNHEISVDLLWLESHPVLHIVCTHTRFQSAAVLRGENVEAILVRHT